MRMRCCCNYTFMIQIYFIKKQIIKEEHFLEDLPGICPTPVPNSITNLFCSSGKFLEMIQAKVYCER